MNRKQRRAAARKNRRKQDPANRRTILRTTAAHLAGHRPLSVSTGALICKAFGADALLISNTCPACQSVILESEAGNIGIYARGEGEQPEAVLYAICSSCAYRVIGGDIGVSDAAGKDIEAQLAQQSNQVVKA